MDFYIVTPRVLHLRYKNVTILCSTSSNLLEK